MKPCGYYGNWGWNWTVGAVLSCFKNAFSGKCRRGEESMQQMAVVGFVPNKYLKTKVTILYVKSGDLKIMRVLFDTLTDKSLISWNTQVSGYVPKGLEEFRLGFHYKLRFCPDTCQ